MLIFLLINVQIARTWGKENKNSIAERLDHPTLIKIGVFRFCKAFTVVGWKIEI